VRNWGSGRVCDYVACWGADRASVHEQPPVEEGVHRDIGVLTFHSGENRASALAASNCAREGMSRASVVPDADRPPATASPRRFGVVGAGSRLTRRR